MGLSTDSGPDLITAGFCACVGFNPCRHIPESGSKAEESSLLWQQIVSCCVCVSSALEHEVMGAASYCFLDNCPVTVCKDHSRKGVTASTCAEIMHEKHELMFPSGATHGIISLPAVVTYCPSR